MRACNKFLTAATLGGFLSSLVIATTPIVYPAKNQTPQQQQKDEGECATWAKQTTGIDPAVVAAAQRARACLFSLRLPGSGWPHAVSGTALDGEATLWAGFAALAAPGMVFQPREFQLLPNLLATDPRLPPAAVLAARSFVGPEPTAAECTVLTDHPPRWPDARHDADFLAWYLGTVACERMRGTAWTNWRDPLLAASLAHQRTDGSFAGSWDPVDVRGKEGGRVFATAMQLHCLLIARRGM